MHETTHRPQDPDYPVEYKFDGATGACTVRSVWIDKFGGAWLESVDGQHVVIPPEVRRLVAKRIKEATFR